MGTAWMDLLQAADETIVSPWVSGRSIRVGSRVWGLSQTPREVGWFTFSVNGRNCRVKEKTDPQPDLLRFLVKGYLIGDRIVPDDARANGDLVANIASLEQVNLIEPGLGRFVRIVAGRMYEDGPLVFQGQDFPMGPEEEVLGAFLRKTESIADIKRVTPALDAAFRLEVFQRAETERRRAELERIRREEEEKRQKEARRQQLVKQLGDGAGRREMAKVDFYAAAKAALAVGGAEYLDHRKSGRKGEMVVQYRVIQRNFECVCDEETLRIIDAGICLVDHATEIKGDTRFTLESLPSVIREADRLRKLVVWRHVDGGPAEDWGDDD